MLHPSRCRMDVVRARHIAMYLSHVALGQSLSAVGTAFGRDRTTVSYACGLIEDMRDDPKIDLELDRLEAILTGAEADE
jgi:chromosomal replication initiation ATPase DnaA